MVAVLIIPQHFEKYRAVAFGGASASSGLGIMMYPWLINSLTEYYGWRGSVLIMAGLILNTCVVSMFFKNNEMPNNIKAKAKTMTSEAHSDGSIITKSLDQIKTHVRGLKKVSFWLFYVGCMLQLCGLGIVYTHIVAYTESRGYSTDWASFIVTLIAALTLCKYV